MRMLTFTIAALALGSVLAAEPPKEPTTKLNSQQVATLALAAFQKSGATVGHFRAESPKFYEHPDFSSVTRIWLVFYMQKAAPFVPDGDMVVVIDDRTGKACVQQMMIPPVPCS
jgi:hypothetical protein